MESKIKASELMLNNWIKNKYEQVGRAYVMVSDVQVVIPLSVDALWVFGFNAEHGGIDYSEE